MNEAAAWVEEARGGAAPGSTATTTGLCRLARILLQTHKLDPGAIERSRRVAHGGHDHRHCQNGHWGARRALPSPAAGELGSAERPITLAVVLNLAACRALPARRNGKDLRDTVELDVAAAESLDLQSNQLTSLPAEIGQLAGLTELDLHRNQLRSLPAEIGQLAGLTRLLLYHNLLTSLPAEIGQLVGLTALDLGSNQLRLLPAEIGQLAGLTVHRGRYI